MKKKNDFFYFLFLILVNWFHTPGYFFPFIFSSYAEQMRNSVVNVCDREKKRGAIVVASRKLCIPDLVV